MIATVLWGLLIPFIGTSLGAACVFCTKRQLSCRAQRFLVAFAAGVMAAASVWSLLLPAIEQSAAMGHFSFVPAAVGFCIGIASLLLLDLLLPHREAERIASDRKTAMLVLAVVLHNVPEGMAVGAVYAGLLGHRAGISAAAALMLSLGIAIQNFPEGAIISLPLAAQGVSRRKSFRGGVLSGVVEPIAGLLTVLLAQWILPLLPYLLSFAAGAMIFVVVAELIPEMTDGAGSGYGILLFTLGFVLMMSLDVALG